MILLATLLLLAGALGEEVTLIPGKVFKFSTPGYPSPIDRPGEMNYNLRTRPGSKITAFCTDYRPVGSPENPCESFELTYSDATKTEKHCVYGRGTRGENVHFTSSANTMRVQMKFLRAQMVECIARSDEEPKAEEVLLKPSDNEFIIQNTRDSIPFLDQLWSFKSSDGKKVLLSCSLASHKSPGCITERFVIDTGAESKVICGSERLEMESQRDIIKFRAVADSYGYVSFRCSATIPVDKVVDRYEPKLKETQVNLELKAGQVETIQSLQYPYGKESENTLSQFKVSAAPGSQVEIYCDDVRVSGGQENACEKVEIKLDDGNKVERFCERQRFIYFVSTANKLTMTMMFKHVAAVNCIARTTEVTNPTVVSLHPNGKTYKFEMDGTNPIPHFSRFWTFEAAERARVSLQCDISFTKMTPCSQNLFEIDTGNEKKTYCDSEKLVEFSKGSTMKLRVQMDGFGGQRFFCVAQAVTGKNPDEFNNLVSEEEDSSERGGRPGKVPTTCDCGRRNRNIRRIYQGKEAQPNDYTWMVGISDHDNFLRCGGSIISRYHVLTAAHCMVNSKTRIKKEDYTQETVVIIGSHSPEDVNTHASSQLREVKETFIHEEWLKFKKHLDVSVLLLKTPIDYNLKVGPICMPRVPPRIINKEIKVTGWGLTEDQRASAFLKETKLFVLDESVCGMDQWLMCTVKNYTSTCSGDSGSPLVDWDRETNRYTQVSLVSFGYSLACTTGRTGNLNVSYVYDWIDDIVKRTVPSVSLCTKMVQN